MVHSFDRLPAQDASFRVRRGRSLPPHPGSPYAGGHAGVAALARALGVDEDLAEALALAHDLGHPPFGHPGERALGACLAAYSSFDHNAQTLRVVTALERRYPAFDGLNLTWETLEGSIGNGPLTDTDTTTSTSVLKLILDYSRRAAIVEFSERGGADPPPLPTTSPTMPMSMEYAPKFDLDDIATVVLPGRIIGDIRATLPGLDAGRQVHELIGHHRGRHRRNQPQACRAGAALGRRTWRANVGRRLLASDGGSRPRHGKLLKLRMYRHARVVAVMDQAAAVVRDLFARYSDHPSRAGDGAEAFSTALKKRYAPVASPISSPA